MVLQTVPAGPARRVPRLHLAALALAGLVAHGAAHAAAPALLYPLFADHMVLQRDVAVPVWGQAAPQAKVEVRYGDALVAATADAAGHWRAALPAQPAGKPQPLTVRSGGAEQTLHDVVVGDVLLCTGQSNMDLPVEHGADAVRVIRAASRSDIRIVKVARRAAAKPSDELSLDLPWTAATPESIPTFSSVCWEMGRNLRRDENVTLGLIQSSWGGSKIEDWMSADALRSVGGYEADLKLVADYAHDPAATTARLDRATDAWGANNDPGLSAKPAWFSPEARDADWSSIAMPGFWEQSDVAELADFNGVIWFRKSIELNDKQAARDAWLDLGRIDERDTVWINGVRVGATSLPTEKRRYRVKAAALKAGANLIVLRVIDERGSGGVNATPETFGLRFGDHSRASLAGDWRYRIAGDFKTLPEPPPVPWMAPRGLTMIYDAMIAPLAPYALRGIVWYQGESNADFPGYEKLLQSWAKSWRALFEQAELPIVIAQLPGYGAYRDAPRDSHWAQLRDAQRAFVAGDPHAALAVLIDLGNPHNIHPVHKQEAGRRIALAVRHVAYGDADAALSAIATQARRDGDAIEVEFTGTGGGLVVDGGVSAIGFELCDAERHCRFVDGQVDGERVRLAGAADAAFVRYAWADTPIVNLYGKNGLPVTPFELALHGR